VRFRAPLRTVRRIALCRPLVHFLRHHYVDPEVVSPATVRMSPLSPRTYHHCVGDRRYRLVSHGWLAANPARLCWRDRTALDSGCRDVVVAIICQCVIETMWYYFGGWFSSASTQTMLFLEDAGEVPEDADDGCWSGTTCGGEASCR
jgi:hypothetical protein